MIVVQKVKECFIRKCIYSDFVETTLISSKLMYSPTWPFLIFQNPRRYSISTEGTSPTENSEVNCGTSSINGTKKYRIRKLIQKQAQEALLEYFYVNRNLQFMDAENMSKNAPHFLKKLLKKINTEGDIGGSITRFLRYQPVNEFEPFFESSGLSPTEYDNLLPRDLMFLSDDELLLLNHNVLCNYGIARNKIGKIYKEATQVFRYDSGVLKLKLKAYEDMGYSQSFMCKVIVCSPDLLIGDVNMEFIKVLEMLKSLGIEIGWVEEHLLEESYYNWTTTLEILRLFTENGFGYKELGGLIRQCPGLIFSGDMTLMLVGLQIKYGFSMDDAFSMFQDFPQIQVEKFVYNFRRCIQFLVEIEMKVDEIGKIVRSHPLLLGTCTLKKASSVYTTLNVWKKRLCSFLQENPEELKKLVIGTKVEPLPESEEEIKSRMLRTKFLLELGYAENSIGMIKALKLFQGKGSELQKRFDSLVKAGVDREDVCEVVCQAPQILNQSLQTIQMKIDFLLNETGYPISTLVRFPKYLTYTCQRIKLRLAMYNWLKVQGKAKPMLAMSSLLKCQEDLFIRRYVMRDPKGPQVWKNLKQQIYPE